MDKKTKNNEVTKKSKTKEVDIHCACAMGDLSEFAPVKPDKKTKKKITKKILKKDDLKKEDSNHK
jgi:hypothetical protein